MLTVRGTLSHILPQTSKLFTESNPDTVADLMHPNMLAESDVKIKCVSSLVFAEMKEVSWSRETERSPTLRAATVR